MNDACLGNLPVAQQRVECHEIPTCIPMFVETESVEDGSQTIEHNVLDAV
jgi:hypothetical protein